MFRWGRDLYLAQRQSDGLLKLGRSGRVTDRVKRLGPGGTVRLLAIVPNFGIWERQVLDRFAHLRVFGEWFRPDLELIAIIKGMAAASEYGERWRLLRRA